MTKILTVGVFDYFHYGHLKLFEQAKNIVPDSYLIVAVQDSDYIKDVKPDTEIFYSTDVRVELVSNLKCVDKVAVYKNVSDIVQHIDFDIFAVGEDQNHPGFQSAIEYCISNGKKVVRMHRTPNISSTEIKNKLNY